MLFAFSAGWQCAVLVNWSLKLFDFQMVKKKTRCDNDNYDDADGVYDILKEQLIVWCP